MAALLDTWRNTVTITKVDITNLEDKLTFYDLKSLKAILDEEEISAKILHYFQHFDLN